MPKTKEQYEKIKLERKNEILRGALYLFALNGPENTSADQITKHIGCSHGLLFHYFPKKEQLVIELFSTIIKTKHREIIKNIDFDESPKFLVRDLLDAYLNALKNPDDEYACVVYLILNLHLDSKYAPKIQIPEDSKDLLDKVRESQARGLKEDIYCTTNLHESMISIMALLKELSHRRLIEGYKKFQCPSSSLVARLILK